MQKFPPNRNEVLRDYRTRPVQWNKNIKTNRGTHFEAATFSEVAATEWEVWGFPALNLFLHTLALAISQ